MTADAMLRLILTSRVYDVARTTPLDHARRLSARTGHQVLLKREDLQPIFTYKLRGAYNRMAHLSEAERRRGVITASAGNHAQGVAYAARHLGLSALIVMPQTTPAIKVTRCGSWAPRSSWPATATPKPRRGATSWLPRPAASSSTRSTIRW